MGKEAPERGWRGWYVLHNMFPQPYQVLRGDITQVYMWGRLLEPATVRRLASCGTAPVEDVLFSTEISQVEVFGAQEDWLPLSSLCR